MKKTTKLLAFIGILFTIFGFTIIVNAADKEVTASSIQCKYVNDESLYIFDMVRKYEGYDENNYMIIKNYFNKLDNEESYYGVDGVSYNLVELDDSYKVYDYNMICPETIGFTDNFAHITASSRAPANTKPITVIPNYSNYNQALLLASRGGGVTIDQKYTLRSSTNLGDPGEEFIITKHNKYINDINIELDVSLAWYDLNDGVALRNIAAAEIDEFKLLKVSFEQNGISFKPKETNILKIFEQLSKGDAPEYVMYGIADGLYFSDDGDNMLPNWSGTPDIKNWSTSLYSSVLENEQDILDDMDEVYHNYIDKVENIDSCITFVVGPTTTYTIKNLGICSSYDYLEEIQSTLEQETNDSIALLNSVEVDENYIAEDLKKLSQAKYKTITEHYGYVMDKIVAISQVYASRFEIIIEEAIKNAATEDEKNQLLQLKAKNADFLNTLLIDYDIFKSSTVFATKDCDFYLGDDIVEILHTLFLVIQIGAVVLTIVLSIIDFMKAVASADADANKKAITKLKTRLIIMVVIFLLPILIEFILDVFGVTENTNPLCK